MAIRYFMVNLATSPVEWSHNVLRLSGLLPESRAKSEMFRIVPTRPEAGAYLSGEPVNQESARCWRVISERDVETDGGRATDL